MTYEVIGYSNLKQFNKRQPNSITRNLSKREAQVETFRLFEDMISRIVKFQSTDCEEIIILSKGENNF